MLSDQLECQIIFLGNYNVFAEKVLGSLQFDFQNINRVTQINSIKLKDYSPDFIVVDSYEVDQDFVDMITSQNARTVFIDDFNNLSFKQVDLVINFRVAALSFKYDSKNVALGTRYFPAKKELIDARKDSHLRNGDLQNVLIFFSGLEKSHWLIDQTIKIIGDQIENTKIHCLVDIDQAEIEKRENMEVSFSPLTQSIEDYFKIADLLISFGGLVKYEAAFCNVPTGVISFNEGQFEDTQSFVEAGLAYDLGYFPELEVSNYSDRLSNLLKDDALRREIAGNCKSQFSTDIDKKILEVFKNIQ